MVKKISKTNHFLGVAIVLIMLSTAIIPIAIGMNTNYQGFDKGPSYKPVVPIEKTTMVNFDEDTLLDDYAYLAAVPTSVFDDGENLFSNPLLFYQDRLKVEEDKELSLDAREGLDYFMEDWMSYCNGNMDQMTLINVPKNSIDASWKAKEYNIIDEDDPYSIASQLALSEWSYSNDAVVAVIEEEFETPDYEFSNEIEYTIPSGEIYEVDPFILDQTNSLNPQFREFTVDDEYKYVRAETWWDCIILGGGIMLPTGDPDMQLYCRYEDDWMQAAASSYWNSYSPAGYEFAQAYVYKPGLWRVGITDMPTQGKEQLSFQKDFKLFILQGNFFKALLGRNINYHVEIQMYPGVEVEIPDMPTFGCRDAGFKLTWDNDNVDLGFSVIGPGGEAIHTVVEQETDEEDEVEPGFKEVHFEGLGECLEGENYKISVFTLNDLNTDVDFKIEYSWKQEISSEEGSSLTSATEGAVLASTLNAPMFYVSPDEISEDTIDAICKLGVENIYLVNIEGYLSDDVRNELLRTGDIVEEYITCDEIYEQIRMITGSNDVVFTTLDPWTKWYMGELEPGDETENAFYLGPSAYIAAHHGTPVIIVDNHPELSSAVVWHNEFWKRYADERYWNLPTVSEMYLTGKRIWTFLQDHDYDREGLETIITVAGQYDIGIPWDRIFPGVGNSGRICGTPVDTSVWISRSMFYPALIFVNPSLQGEVSMINGSLSTRKLLGILSQPLLSTLKITRDAQEEQFLNPVVCSFVGYSYRFNERASKYYGAQYECANGMIPGITPTMNAIDEGSIKKYTGKEGAYFPDMSQVDVVPFYLNKGGFSCAFSTAMDSVVENLNAGSLMWIHLSHGIAPEGGKTLFWDPKKGWDEQGSKGFVAKIFGTLTQGAAVMKDENPAWVYEWILGSTDEPDSMSNDIDGRIPFTTIKSPFPAFGQDWVISRRPIRELLNQWLFPNKEYFPFRNVDTVNDGIIATSMWSRFQTAWSTAMEIEENLGNLHSSGFITNICETSNTYLHMMLVRHGSVFQVQDPWSTSWYAGVWIQSIPKDIIQGYTVGEAYTRGISSVGTLYLDGAVGGGPQWWWDTMENVVYFGDPDLRQYVPGTDYSDANNWDQEDTESLKYDKELSINGHMPFGATDYPKEREPLTILEEYLWLIISTITVIILIMAIAVISKKK